MRTLTPSIDLLHTLFDLDAEAGLLRWKVRTSRRIAIGDVAGCPNGKGYWQVPVNGRLHLVHRIIFFMVHGYMPASIDHINGVRGDNRAANLRAATHSQNMRNYPKPVTNTSGVKGVSFNKSVGKWVAGIGLDGKYVYLGCFADIADAAACRKQAEIMHFGEFARHE